MALPEKYTPEFTAATGDDMTGAASPETLTDEFAKIAVFFDPTATHESGNAGGIHKGNLATNSGIITSDTIGSQSVASATNATNVATNINGHAITDIFESNGTTAKNATLASSAKGDTRFQVSGCAGSSQSVSATNTITLQSLAILLPTGKSLVLKKARYYTSLSYFRFQVQVASTYWRSTDNCNEETPETNLATGSSVLVYLFIKIYNADSSPRSYASDSGWWLDFSIE